MDLVEKALVNKLSLRNAPLMYQKHAMLMMLRKS